jgi:hypothetical protein
VPFVNRRLAPVIWTTLIAIKEKNRTLITNKPRGTHDQGFTGKCHCRAKKIPSRAVRCGFGSDSFDQSPRISTTQIALKEMHSAYLIPIHKGVRRAYRQKVSTHSHAVVAGNDGTGHRKLRLF